MAYKRANCRVQMDETKVREALNAIVPPGELFEIRMLDDGWTSSGYFTDVETAVQALKETSITDGASVYITLNHIKAGCYGRKQHNRFMENIKPTTSDKDIDYYQYLLLDFDPNRVKGVSSTDAELSAAAIIAGSVITFLREQGWPEPIQGMSGNGYHALYWIAHLPACDKKDDPNTVLIQKVLEVLNQKFGNDACEVDCVNYNPSRICKLYGTCARKGAHTPDRPHRLSKLLKVPDNISQVTREQLEAIAALWTDQKSSVKVETIKTKSGDMKVHTVAKQDYGIEDLEVWMDEHGIEHDPPVEYDGGLKYILKNCVFDPSHAGTEAAMFVSATGVFGYKCQHNSCKDRHFKDVVQKVDPDRLLKSSTSEPDSKSNDNYRPLKIVSASDLNSHEYKKPDYIVDGILYPGLTIFAGPPKYGKSFLSLDLACSVASGAPFLERSTSQGDVLYLDLEGTEWRTNERLSQLGYSLCPERLDHTYEADTVDNHLIRQLTEQIDSMHSPKLMIIDTMARVKGKVRRGEDGYAAEYRFLFPLHELALNRNVAIVCVTHTRKSGGIIPDDPMEMIHGSTAQYGTADNGWVLTGKREESSKILHCSGRDYEGVDLEVDFSGGKWVPLGTTEEMQSRRAAAKYDQDPTVKTIIHLVESSGGLWRGTMTDLINEVAMLTGQYPAVDSTRMGIIVRSYTELLAKRNHIITLTPSSARKVNGKSRKEYTFKKNGFAE